MQIRLAFHQDFPSSGLKIIRSSLKEYPYSTIELPAYPESVLHTIDIRPEGRYTSEELVSLLRDIDKSTSKLDNTYKIFLRSLEARFTITQKAYEIELATGKRYKFTSLDKMIDRYRAFCRAKTMIICPFIDSTGSINTINLGNGYWLLDLGVCNPAGHHKIAVGVVLQDIEIGSEDPLLRTLDHCMQLFFLYFFLYLRKDIEPEELAFTTVKIKGSNLSIKKPFHQNDDLFLDDCYGYKDSVDYALTNNQYIVTPEELNKLPTDNNIYRFAPLVAATRHHYGHQSPLYIAFTSFEAAYTNEIWHDEIRLIMVVTALEALFSISNSELKYRLSSNIAWFLHPQPDEYSIRKNTISRVSKIYDFRSGVIHGTKLRGIPQVGTKGEKDYIDDALTLFQEIILLAANRGDLGHFETIASKKTFIEMLQVGHYE